MSIIDTDDPVALFLAEAEAVELTLTYIEQLNILAEVVGVALRDVFENLSSVNRADIAAFIAEASPYAEAGANAGADMAAAYLSQLTWSCRTSSTTTRSCAPGTNSPKATTTPKPDSRVRRSPR